FLRGLIAGSGTNQSSPQPVPPAGNNPFFAALFFDANELEGAAVISGAPFPMGVSPTRLTYGPQVGLASANTDYSSSVYSAFTDFGTPGAPGFSTPVPGLSGVQDLGGQLLIGAGNTATTSLTP